MFNYYILFLDGTITPCRDFNNGLDILEDLEDRGEIADADDAEILVDIIIPNTERLDKVYTHLAMNNYMCYTDEMHILSVRAEELEWVLTILDDNEIEYY